MKTYISFSQQKHFSENKDEHLQKSSLQTKYLVNTMSLFLDPIFKWQWKHYVMFEKRKKEKIQQYILQSPICKLFYK